MDVETDQESANEKCLKAERFASGGAVARLVCTSTTNCMAQARRKFSDNAVTSKKYVVWYSYGDILEDRTYQSTVVTASLTSLLALRRTSSCCCCWSCFLICLSRLIYSSKKFWRSDLRQSRPARPAEDSLIIPLPSFGLL